MIALVSVGVPLIITSGIAGYYLIKKKMKKTLMERPILDISDEPYVRNV